MDEDKITETDAKGLVAAIVVDTIYDSDAETPNFDPHTRIALEGVYPYACPDAKNGCGHACLEHNKMEDTLTGAPLADLTHILTSKANH